MVTAVLSAMISFLKTNEMQSKHEDSHRNFNKLFRNICMELSMPPIQRRRALDTCRAFREEFDRLISEAPTIPSNVVRQFNNEFYHLKNKPEIASDFDSDIKIFGREKQRQDNLQRFQKIRHFYRWMSTMNRNRTDYRTSFDLECAVASLDSCSSHSTSPLAASVVYEV